MKVNREVDGVDLNGGAALSASYTGTGPDGGATQVVGDTDLRTVTGGHGYDGGYCHYCGGHGGYHYPGCHYGHH